MLAVGLVIAVSVEWASRTASRVERFPYIYLGVILLGCPMTTLPQLEVSCANCGRFVTVNRFLVGSTGDWPKDQIHSVTTTEAFLGTVHCPNCYHFTTYQR